MKLPRLGRRRLWPMVAILLALMVVFEVGIRHVPRHGMTVTYAYYFNSAAGIGPRVYSVTRDR